MKQTIPNQAERGKKYYTPKKKSDESRPREGCENTNLSHVCFVPHRRMSEVGNVSQSHQLHPEQPRVNQAGSTEPNFYCCVSTLLTSIVLWWLAESRLFGRFPLLTAVTIVTPPRSLPLVAASPASSFLSAKTISVHLQNKYVRSVLYPKHEVDVIVVVWSSDIN